MDLMKMDDFFIEMVVFNSPVTSRFPGPALEVSTKKVTGFPTIPFWHSRT